MPFQPEDRKPKIEARKPNRSGSGKVLFRAFTHSGRSGFRIRPFHLASKFPLPLGGEGQGEGAPANPKPANHPDAETAVAVRKDPSPVGVECLPLWLGPGEISWEHLPVLTLVFSQTLRAFPPLLGGEGRGEVVVPPSNVGCSILSKGTRISSPSVHPPIQCSRHRYA
jgi:hypothetical protein